MPFQAITAMAPAAAIAFSISTTGWDDRAEPSSTTAPEVRLWAWNQSSRGEEGSHHEENRLENADTSGSSDGITGAVERL